ncbi:MAG: hypothetical protein ACKOAS_02930 [Verrucomicrobiota bacterium]
MNRSRLAIACAGLLLGATWQALAKSPRLEKEEMQSAVFVETIALPSPGEFLIAVDKEFEPNWSQFVQNSIPPTTMARDHLAFQLGVLLADAHVAIEAQDGQAAKNVGRDLIATARKLNVGQNVLARGQNIADIADQADWRTLREEMDATQNDIRLSMQEQNDQDLLVFLMLGSWLRQMELASALTEKNPSPGGAALIVQPMILNHHLERLESLPPKVRSRPLATEMLKGLHSIKPRMDQGLYGPLTEESLRTIATEIPRLLSTAKTPAQAP